MSEPRALLATEDGLITVNLDGEMVNRELAGAGVVSIAVAGETTIVGTERQGVMAGSHGRWEELGLESPTIWTVAAGAATKGRYPVIYAGIEPAAVWRRESSGKWHEMKGLESIEGYEDWESPWGPADLSTVIVEGDRMIVGVEVGGVAISHDGGETWDARNEGLYEDVHHVIADGETLYATTGGGFHITHDEGRSWKQDNTGLDRGYTQGIAVSDGFIVVAAASGPPPFWDTGGPRGAIFRSPAREISFEMMIEGFAGNIGRQAMASAGSIVVAGTTEGEFLVSRDAGATFEDIIEGFPAVNAAALID